MKIRTSIMLTALLAPLLAAAAGNESFYSYHNSNQSQALLGLQQLAGQQDKEALYYQGMMNLYGYGVARNQQQAIALLTRSGERDYLPAQMFLGKYYLQKKNDPEIALHWFKKAAELNDVNAQMYAASAYLYGYGVKENPEAAKLYYIKAAKNGNTVAQYTLAEHFIDSKHQQNKKMGVIWLQKAVEKGNVNAAAELGKQYLLGKNIEKDPVKAFELLTSAANANNITAISYLGEYYQEQGDKTKALEWYRKAASANDADAQYKLASLYLSDDLAIQNQQEGFSWMLKAAQNGNTNAQQMLSKMYEDGVGVVKDTEIAAQWAEKAKKSEKTNFNTIYRVGNKKLTDADRKALAMQWITDGKTTSANIEPYQLKGILTQWTNAEALQDGSYNLSPKFDLVKKSQIFKPKLEMTNPKEVKIAEFISMAGSLNYQNKKPHKLIPQYTFPAQQDYSALFADYKNQAEHGYAQAQFKLGLMYENGLGTAKNMDQAVQWYRSSAKQNYMKAQYTMGILYLEGDGVPKDYAKAMKYLERAAYRGDVYAEYMLGLVNEFGLGEKGDANYIEADLQSAKSMYSLSASQGYPRAQFNLAELYSSGLLSETKNLNTQKFYYDLVLELYQNAVKQGVKSAELGLAYYYVGDAKNTDKQQWAFDVAKKAADAGDNVAAFIVAVMYDRGIGVTADRSDAIFWYKKAVAQQNPVAEFVLGTYYYLGEGVSVDKEMALSLLKKAEAKQFPFAYYNLAVIQQQQDPNSTAFLSLLQQSSNLNYNKASIELADYYMMNSQDKKELSDAAVTYKKLADLGYSTAQLKLGYMYENGIYFDKDMLEAKAWYEAAAKQNNILAQYLLANMYQVGKLGERDPKLATYWYQKSESLGYEPAMVALGLIAETDNYDYPTAIKWYQKAAATGDPRAQFNLGLMYQYGKGVPVDYRESFKLYEKAAATGLMPAQYNLATLYLKGQGVRVNNKLAFEGYQKLAAKGSVYALYQLGLLNEAGVGTPIDMTKAMEYYKQAAEKGNDQAKLALVRLSAFGWGGETDKREAVNFFTRAAEQGDAFAQYQLAQMYHKGVGVTKNLSMAKTLYSKSLQNGHVEAQSPLASLTPASEIKTEDNAKSDKNAKASAAKTVAVTQAAIPQSLQRKSVKILNSPNLMYMQAITDLNQGAVQDSVDELKAIIKEFPNFAPAKRVFDLINLTHQESAEVQQP